MASFEGAVDEGGVDQKVIETALDERMADHLGYDKHDPAGDNTGNSRNVVRT